MNDAVLAVRGQKTGTIRPSGKIAHRTASTPRTAALRRSVGVVSLVGLLILSGLWLACCFRAGYAGKHYGMAVDDAAILFVGCGQDSIPAGWRVSPGWRGRTFQLPSPTLLPDGGFFVIYSDDSLELYLPLALPTLLLVLSFVLSKVPYRRNRVQVLERCSDCGEELIDTSQPCPGCGHVAESVDTRIDRRLADESAAHQGECAPSFSLRRVDCATTHESRMDARLYRA